MTEPEAHLPAMQTQLEEHVCRICRGEGTTEDPLFFPCKCRGSIKYIHQGCLEEWLERSRRDQSCDICHEKYRFTTLYDENTPERVPLKLMVAMIVRNAVQFGNYALTVFGLVYGVGIQVPILFEVTRRFMNFFVDHKTTHEDFFIHLLYGDIIFEGEPYSFVNLAETLWSTYFKSIIFLAVFILAHLALYLEHDWVSRDTGFKKLVNKNVGRQFNDLPVNQRGVDPRILNVDENAQREFDRVMGFAAEQPVNPAERRRREIIRNRVLNVPDAMRNNFGRELLDDEDENSDEDPDFVPNDDSSDDELDNLVNGGDNEAVLDVDVEARRRQHERRVRDLILIRDHLRDHVNRNPNAQDGIEDILNQVPDIPNVLPPNPNHVEALPPFPFPIRQPPIQQRRQPQGGIQDIANVPPAVGLGQPLPAVQAPPPVDDIIEQLPVMIIVTAAHILLAVYLAFAYLVPLLLGTWIFQLLAFMFIKISSIIPFVLQKFKLYSLLLQAINGFDYLKKLNPVFDEFLDSFIVGPVTHTLIKVYNQDAPLTTPQRLIPLGIFYGIAYIAILQFLFFMKRRHNDTNPLKGFQRQIYTVLFDFVCTVKVFTIFSIELIVFPAFCGLLIEFVLTPFFFKEAKLALNQFFMFRDYFFFRIVANWATGTLYMCLFALYVGMARSYILRPGVLFFIRSPEDPNARLVHDALVRPLSLQISRIGLSGFVYTLFILIGFGTISFGMRAMGSQLVPIYVNSRFALPYAFLIVSAAYSNQALLKKYIRQYWSRAFKSVCLQTRLSSFILGYHNPKERGYVVYKSVLSRFKRGVKPDYSQPKLYSQALELFKDPANDQEAYFIPDGNLIRAPKSDIVSRKFVKKLFISVTKDDIPLKSKEKLEADFARFQLDEFDESEDELTTTNQYEIVYRPPMFGMRVIVFIVMLWVFAVLLIGGVALIANFIGRPVLILHRIIPDRVGLKDFTQVAFTFFTLSNPNHSYIAMNADSESICVGLFIILQTLKKYDAYIVRKHLHEEGQDLAADEVGLFGNLIGQARGALPIDGKFLLGVASFTYFLIWNVLIHRYAINRPFNYFFGGDAMTTPEEMLSTVHAYTIPIHALVAIQSNYKPLRGRFLLNPDILGISSVLLFKYTLHKFLTTHFVVILWKVGLSLYEYEVNGSRYNGYWSILAQVASEEIFLQEQVAIWPIVLVAAMVIEHTMSLIKYLKRVNSEVKEIYYAKGKTLENTPIEDEQ